MHDAIEDKNNYMGVDVANYGGAYGAKRFVKYLEERVIDSPISEPQ